VCILIGNGVTQDNAFFIITIINYEIYFSFMLPYKIFTTIDLGFFSIQVWGLMAAIGVLIAALLAVYRGKKLGIKEDTIYDLVFYTIVSGIIGSRIMYVIEEWELYKNNLFGIFKIWQGGLSFTGGLVLAVIVAYYYLNKNKLDFWKYADLLAPSLVIGHLIARIGCHFTGMHVFSETGLPWAIYQAGALRHPGILYEIVYLGIVFFALLKLSEYRLKKGTVFIIYLALYSLFRFFSDFLRIDPTFFGFTATQYLMIIIFLGSIIWYKFNK